MPSVKIDGTWMEIDTPSAKIGGTWMEMDTGYCKIDGTWHEWDMGPSPIPVTITGTGNSDNCYVEINDTKYYGATSGLEVLGGSEIRMVARGSNASYTGAIIINGTTVKQTSGNEYATYIWNVPYDAKSVSIALSHSNVVGRITTKITVTTT